MIDKKRQDLRYRNISLLFPMTTFPSRKKTALNCLKFKINK